MKVLQMQSSFICADRLGSCDKLAMEDHMREAGSQYYVQQFYRMH